MNKKYDGPLAYVVIPPEKIGKHNNKWTKKHPDEPGYWWMRSPKDKNYKSIIIVNDDLKVWCSMYDDYSDLSDLDGVDHSKDEFAGPIPEPID